MRISLLKTLPVAIAALLAAGISAAAEDGVSADKIVFGQAAALDGPAGALGQGMKVGLDAAFAEVNKAGGVKGRKLELKSVDDGYEPNKSIEAVKKLLGEDKVFAIAVIGARDIARYAVPISAEQLIERQARRFADDIPTRDIDGSSNTNQGLAAPALLVSQALRSERKQLLMQPLWRKRIHSEDLFADAAPERPRDLLHPRVARRQPKPLDAFTGTNAHQDFAGSRSNEVTNPMRAAIIRRAKNEDFKTLDLRAHVATPAKPLWLKFAQRLQRQSPSSIGRFPPRDEP